MFLQRPLSVLFSSSTLALGLFSTSSTEAGEVFKWVENAYTHGSEFRGVLDTSKCQLDKRSDLAMMTVTGLIHSASKGLLQLKFSVELIKQPSPPTT
ncbi:hypothetical protein [Endozoicomonas numazuensis]|uniref:Lipid/polyisoprenoid-binding YceI-like domain-containing protein n=1 Tax=Endozoicomonas numazuensis TaxID=1137799 RepID=A0A081NDS4_9GAMM|nr:hypothetical protein [Endozoicomonas numazuensis]KEQ16597.1 hypothetical protein GZ78_22475 [Endozoicomonas numazuensis]